MSLRPRGHRGGEKSRTQPTHAGSYQRWAPCAAGVASEQECKSGLDSSFFCFFFFTFSRTLNVSPRCFLTLRLNNIVPTSGHWFCLSAIYMVMQFGLQSLLGGGFGPPSTPDRKGQKAPEPQASKGKGRDARHSATTCPLKGVARLPV